MPNARPKELVAAARAALTQPLDYEAFLEKLNPKDRLNAARHIAACEAEPDRRHASLWRRLACTLMTLASHAVKLNGRQSMQFYVADGKYRMQVLALEDQREGMLAVYCADVLDEAIKGGLLAVRKRGTAEANNYIVPDSGETLAIDRLDGKTENAAAFFKDMLGWNRRALRILVPFSATDSQIAAVENLCAMSIALRG